MRQSKDNKKEENKFLKSDSGMLMLGRSEINHKLGRNQNIEEKENKVIMPCLGSGKRGRERK